MDRKLYRAVVLALALFAAGCDNEVENATGPIAPAPTTTDNFEGTINVNGANTHTFATVAAGPVTATLTEVTPDNTIAIGLVLGTWNGVICNVQLAMDFAVQGNQLVGSVSGPGSLCVRVHDNGRMSAPLSYKLSVVHP
jgi:hypothetical protein